MRIGRFIIGFFVSLLVVVAAAIIFEHFAQFKNWFSGDTQYFMFYPSIAGIGAVLGSIITWLFVAPGGTGTAPKTARPAKAATGKKARQGKLTGKSEAAADISSMPSFDFDKAQKDIKEASQKGQEESKQ